MDEDLKQNFIQYIVAVNDYEDFVLDLIESHDISYRRRLLNKINKVTSIIDTFEKSLFNYFEIDEDITTEELRKLI